MPSLVKDFYPCPGSVGRGTVCPRRIRVLYPRLGQWNGELTADLREPDEILFHFRGNFRGVVHKTDCQSVLVIGVVRKTDCQSVLLAAAERAVIPDENRP